MDRGQFLGTGGPGRAWIPAIAAGICLLVSSSLALATQGGAQGQEITSRSWENYFGVAILPSNRVIVVGDKGIAMTSDDQGRTWTSHQLKKGEKFFDLYSVAFVPDGTVGWAVGDGGAIFRSSDKGSTWTVQKAATNAALLKVAAIDAQKACAVGEHGAIVCTSDGGSNWNLQTIKDLVYFDIAFTDANNGWAVGEFKTTIHTADGGKTWAVQSGGERSATADPYFAIVFGNPTDGLVLGLNGASVATTNGGQTWQNRDLPNWHESLFAAAPLPAQGSNDFFAGGENGAIARIENGKASPVRSGTSNAITSLAFSSHVGIAVGLGGTILRTEDGGASWQVLDGGHITEARGQ
jgi:photosystem II stability/assembly factor-like uncharacterized protein